MRTFALLALAIAACGPPPGTVTRAAYGDAWPLTVDEGTLHCDGDRITIEAAGRTYAINGTARMAYPDMARVDEILADDPTYDGWKMSLADLMQVGVALCD